MSDPLSIFSPLIGAIVGRKKQRAQEAAPLPPPPPVPTIDEAARSEESSRKFLRRRGRMATLIAGQGAGTPNVAGKQLLG